MKTLTRMVALLLMISILFGGVALPIYAQDSTEEPSPTDAVAAPIAEEGDVVYEQTNSLISLLLDRLPMVALVILVLGYAWRLLSGTVDSTGFTDELTSIRQSKLFSDAELSYERVKTPTSDMTFDTLIQLLMALIMIPFLPSNFVKGLQDGVAFLRDLQDGPDGDETTLAQG